MIKSKKKKKLNFIIKYCTIEIRYLKLASYDSRKYFPHLGTICIIGVFTINLQ